MYLGCLFDAEGYHTQPVTLSTTHAVFDYCFQHYKNWPRIEITDADDYCVLEIINQQMKVPFPDGTFKYLDLSQRAPEDLIFMLNLTPKKG